MLSTSAITANASSARSQVGNGRRHARAATVTATTAISRASGGGNCSSSGSRHAAPTSNAQ